METPSRQSSLRYCPVVGHNVIVEFEYGENPTSGACPQTYRTCHDFHHCTREKGGCTNKVFTCK